VRRVGRRGGGTTRISTTLVHAQRDHTHTHTHEIANAKQRTDCRITHSQQQNSQHPRWFHQRKQQENMPGIASKGVLRYGLQHHRGSICTCTHIYTHTHPPTHTCIHIHLYIYTYIHAHKYTHTLSLSHSHMFTRKKSANNTTVLQHETPPKGTMHFNSVYLR
jgi:hypothetical protein